MKLVSKIPMGGNGNVLMRIEADVIGSWLCGYAVSRLVIRLFHICRFMAIFEIDSDKQTFDFLYRNKSNG